MAYGTFNLGTDLSVTVISNNTGQPIALGGRLVEFDAKPDIKDVESDPIDNQFYTTIRQVYGKWTGSLKVDRATGDLDILMSQQEANYHAGGPQSYYTITALVNNSEPGYAPTQLIFNQCTIKLTTMGTWNKNDKVSVTVDFTSINRPASGN